jgi:dihydroorotase
LVAHLLESFGALDNLEGFVSTFGRRFYQREVASAAGGQVTLERVPRVVEMDYTAEEADVVPFWAGKELCWSIVVHS